MKIVKIPVRFLLAFVIALVLMVPSPAFAQEGDVLGIHILNIHELVDVQRMFEPVRLQESEQKWRYVTVPLTLADLEKSSEWQQFFYSAREQRIIPIVRLTTRFENGAWQVPNRKEVVALIDFLQKLEWPTDQKHIIVFNEVNHAKEWSGRLDPAEYAEVFRFASSWAHATDSRFVVLPAAMDLAAPNGSVTREAFTYLEQMHVADPEIFSYVDVWNSHSYPNPGFSSSPERTTQDSLRGFQHELSWLKEKTGRDFQVIITETGWVSNRSTFRWLESYYTYALQHVWSDPRVIAVTPFVLKGDPGPFSGFGFIDRNGNGTLQLEALQRALVKVEQE